MSKRYYLSKIKQYTDAGTYHGHKMQEYPEVDALGGNIATDSQGVPLHPAILVMVAAQDHTAFKADAELIEIPAGRDGLNMKIEATHTPTKLAFRAKMKAIGFGDVYTEAVSLNTRGWRDLVDDLGKLNNPAFSVDAFDLAES